MDKLATKNDLLGKLRIYRDAPDDENVQYKQKIKHALLLNPCLLYALNEASLYNELFDPSDKEHWEWMRIERLMFLPMNARSIGNGMKI